MCRLIVLISFFFVLCLMLSVSGGTAQQGPSVRKGEKSSSDESRARGVVVRAELFWDGGLDGKKEVEIKSEKDLAMLSASMKSIRDINLRTYGIGEEQDRWGTLHLHTAYSHHRIGISKYGYWLNCEFPQFSQCFFSVPLTNTLDSILQRYGTDIPSHQKAQLTGYSRILWDEEDWKKIKQGEYQKIGPEHDIFNSQLMPGAPVQGFPSCKNERNSDGQREGHGEKESRQVGPKGADNRN